MRIALEERDADIIVVICVNSLNGFRHVTSLKMSLYGNPLLCRSSDTRVKS